MAFLPRWVCPPLLFGGGGGGLEDGWTGPGELVKERGFTFGLALGKEGFAFWWGGGGATNDFAGWAFVCVGVGPTGLGLGDKLGDEF